ncbi:hypothetical protein ACFXP3_15060 [Streptomyces sp. NPDC059096]|uniref:hypothetical protein n=1 Tax=Streptomyces sp. NPDC059096 TaxID=3346727 RepID=UPI00368788AE
MSIPSAAGGPCGLVADALPSPLDSVHDSREAARWTLAPRARWARCCWAAARCSP